MKHVKIWNFGKKNRFIQNRFIPNILGVYTLAVRLTPLPAAAGISEGDKTLGMLELLISWQSRG